ncbi:MAG TPA: N-acetylglucosamine-6-phosphate deacetylase [Anaerolineales bacterium]|nr:N-acetylglucosamine-6-phosphate deacetylase [Anaerolineales bacterium]
MTNSLAGTLITPFETIPHGAVHWDPAGTITRVETAVPDPDRPQRLICPGFINLHVHGGAGADTLDATAGALAALARDQAHQGVTAFLPTAASASHEDLLAVCRAVREFRALQDRETAGAGAGAGAGARALGLHLEGPYFAAEKAGAQNPAHFRDPDRKAFEELQREAGGAIRLVSLAPERDPNGGFVKYLRSAGVRAAAGHTNASYAVMQAAIERGLSHATHIFNAMPGFDHRAPTGLSALLEDGRVSLELIPDCTDLPHVHPVVIRLLKRMAGVERICSVTDAVAAAGRPDGVYRLGELEVRKAGEVVILERPWAERGERRLAGSALAMNGAVRNLVERCGFTMEEAVRTVTDNPARAIGVDPVRGSLAPGKRADLAVLDPVTFEVLETYVGGARVFSNG